MSNVKTMTANTIAKFNELNEINYYKSILNKQINIYDKQFNKIFEAVQLVSFDSYNLFIIHNNKLKMLRKEAIGLLEES